MGLKKDLVFSDFWFIINIYLLNLSNFLWKAFRIDICFIKTFWNPFKIRINKTLPLRVKTVSKKFFSVLSMKSFLIKTHKIGCWFVNKFLKFFKKRFYFRNWEYMKANFRRNFKILDVFYNLFKLSLWQAFKSY